jgi:arylsulfatase A-like enzyme
MRSKVLIFILSLFGTFCEAADRPNIVIMLADDQTWSDSGAYGNDVVKTPNLDRLSAEGMRFTNCFTATAMCAPTRQQLYTGVFPIRNGAFPNHSEVKPGTRSMVHHFGELGYRVGLSGKKHFGPEESFPFENLTMQGDLNIPKIRRFVARDKAQPFALVVTSHSPHLPWKEGDPSQYDPAKVKVPPYLVDSPKTRQALTKYYAEITDFDREVGEVLSVLDKADQVDNTIFVYTSEQGAQFPHGKWTCYDTGLHTALIIRWPQRVKAGSTSDALVQYVDILPTLLEAVGVDPTTIDTGRPGAPDGGTGFDGRSFLPVLLGTKDQHDDLVYGVHTTRGIINGSWYYPIRSIRTRRYKLIWNLHYDAAFENVLVGGRDNGGYWQEWLELAKTNPHAKQMVEGYQHRPEFEFYDLANDPYELDNLADSEEQADRIKELKSQLDAWMKQQGDRGNETELTAKPHPTQTKPGE